VKKIPPAPPGWNKTLADLMAEVDSGLRQSVGSPEMDWARDYERSLLPSDTRFPCEGEVYEALDDILVDYLTSWATPWWMVSRSEPHSRPGRALSQEPVSNPLSPRRLHRLSPVKEWLEICGWTALSLAICMIFDMGAKFRIENAYINPRAPLKPTFFFRFFGKTRCAGRYWLSYEPL
jgi:hypothetical protein